MTDQEKMMGLLREVAEVAPSVEWVLLPDDGTLIKKDPTVKAYRGSTALWTFLVISFSIEDQGHPAGSRGYDGTGTRSAAQDKPLVVLRLTRDLAERFFEMAEKALVQA